MSGIAAIFRRDGGPVDPHDIAAMRSSTSFRASEGFEVRTDGSLALGACISHHRPGERELAELRREDGTYVWAILDGYIANRASLLRLLAQPYCLASDCSDTELLLAAFEKWQDATPQHVDGEFAWVIWDSRRQELVCARDHQGLRPLYLCERDDRYIIASEPAAVLAALPSKPPMDRTYLAQVGADEFYDRSATIWEGIKRLPMASVTVAGRERLRSAAYWSPPLDVSIRYSSAAEYAEHYLDVLTKSVRECSRSNDPVGCEVSGGLDSSAIFAVGDRLIAQGEYPAPDLLGFTLDNPRGSRADEMVYVEAVEEHLGRKISREPLFIPPLDWFIAQSREDKDVPPFPNGIMSRNLETAMRSAGCRVKLNGIGGDQWLTGSTRSFREAIGLRDSGMLASLVRGEMRASGSLTGLGRSLRKIAPALLPGPLDRAVQTMQRERKAARWRPPALLPADMQERLAASRADYLRALPESPMCDWKVARWQDPFMALVFDQNARQMAHSGLEPRHPMLTRDFITFACATPEQIRLCGGRNKRVHRDAMAGYLPELVTKRMTKAGFSLVFEKHGSALRDSVLKSDLLARPAPEQGEKGASCCSATLDDLEDSEIWGYYLINQLPFLAEA